MKAIERVRRTQPAAYLKILALLVPREQSDRFLTIEPAAATTRPVIESSQRKNRLMLEADTAVGPRERKPRKVLSPPGA